MTGFDRDDLIDGLRQLRCLIIRAGLHGVSVHIVGGAALQLAYFDRPTTVDIDAHLEPASELAPLIAQIAEEHNWPYDWLNDKAAQFIPAWGRSVQWQPLLASDDLSIWVAPLDALLAMKLHAMNSRPGRDTGDVAQLLKLTDVADVEEAESLYSDFYPGDGFTQRTVDTVMRMYSLGLPAAGATPIAPDFSL